MAKQPRSRESLSPAYRARLEREEARAATEGRAFDRKKARGKKSDEYTRRRESERRRGVLSSQQKLSIRAFCLMQSGRDEALLDVEEIAEFTDSILGWAEAAGFAEFRKQRAVQQAYEKEYRANQAAGWPGGYFMRSGLLESLVAQAVITVPNRRFYFYH